METCSLRKGLPLLFANSPHPRKTHGVCCKSVMWEQQALCDVTKGRLCITDPLTGEVVQRGVTFSLKARSEKRGGGVGGQGVEQHE